MAAIKEIRNRIRSIKNTAKITKAMELISAAKMKRAQDSATSGKPYSNLINQVLRSLVLKIDPRAHPLLIGNQVEKDLIIAVSSDRGLAGAFNSNLFKRLSEFQIDSEFISVGTKVRTFLAKTGRNVIADFPLPENGTLETARGISKMAVEKFRNGEIGRVFVIYTEFYTTLKQEPLVRELLPIMDLGSFRDLVAEEEAKKEEIEFKFEPAADTILDQLLPHFVLMEMQHYLLESRASEHSSRMLAMKNATDNALELVNDLTLTYNQIRQETITKEILDISTAAVVLE